VLQPCQQVYQHLTRRRSGRVAASPGDAERLSSCLRQQEAFIVSAGTEPYKIGAYLRQRERGSGKRNFEEDYQSLEGPGKMLALIWFTAIRGT